MAVQLKEKDLKVLSEFKDKIKALPVDERVAAVAIYRLTEDYFKQLAVEEAEEERLDAEYKVAEAAVLKENDAIITGERVCSEQELANLSQFLKEGETCDPSVHNTKKAIDDYWLTVLKNSHIYLGEGDHEALKALTSIDTKEEKKGESDKDVTVTLKFKENPFFSNSELTSTVHIVNDMPKSSTGTTISWKDGKDLTKKSISKSQKNKKTGQKRTVTKEVKTKSLFGLFANFTDKDDVEESYNEEEEEQPNLYVLNDVIEQLQDVVPFSLEYFLGVIEDEDDEFEDDEEGDDADDDEDEDEDDAKAKKRPAKGPKKGGDAGKPAGGAPGEGAKEECKKQ